MIKLKASRIPIYLCNEIKEGMKVVVNGKLQTVVRLIVMQNGAREIEDIEVLLNKKKNQYFSWNKYVKGESWVTELYRIGEIKQERES